MSETPGPPTAPRHGYLAAWIGRIAGPVLAALVYILLSALDNAPTPAGCATAAVATLMAAWWMTEALPLPVTSLLPIILFPLTGVRSMEDAAAPYANKFIFLFMGGFMLALAMEKWNLHRRIALLTVLLVGTRPNRLVAGFMLATALLSMWISNTATTVMMLPIGMSLVTLLQSRLGSLEAGGSAESSTVGVNFAVCLMLGTAYGASIGGVGTIIGSPPNTFFVGYMSEQGYEIGFAQWMLMAAPLVVIFLVIAWLLLTRVVFPIRVQDLPGGRALIRQELAKLGPVSGGEKIVLVVFALTAVAWVVRGPLAKWDWLVEQLPVVAKLNDPLIAIIASVCLFAIPVNIRRNEFVLDWPTAVKLPWGVLLLFGGGLSLAGAISSSALAQWIGSHFEALGGMPLWVIIVCVTALIIFLTEITSNLATATALLPILFGIATSLEVDPLLVLTPVAFAASCAFMLPVATPPNAIVFGSGQVRISQMVKAGLWLNLVGVALIPLLTYCLVGWVLG